MLPASFYDLFLLIEFLIFLIIFIQLISNVLYFFSGVAKLVFASTIRKKKNLKDFYIDDFFCLHERGVNLIFIFFYIHLFKKLYLSVFEYEDKSAWKNGVLIFLIFQVVVFFDLVFCYTYFSDIILTRISNIFHYIKRFSIKILFCIYGK